MTKQPETMDELVRSIYDHHQNNPYAIVPTLATHKLATLPSGHKAIAQQSLVAHLSQSMAFSNLIPGEEYLLRGQTDQYYLDHDHDSTFIGMRASILNLATRNR